MTVPCGVNGRGLKITALGTCLHRSEGTAGQSWPMVWGHRAPRVPGAGTGTTAQPVPFCSQRGWGWALITPSPNPPGRRRSQTLPAHRDLLGWGFASTRVSPFGHGTSTVPANKLGPSGTATVAVFGGALAQLTWSLMQDNHPHTCALPQMNERQECEYRPIFLPTSVSPAGPPYPAGPPLLPAGVVM